MKEKLNLTLVLMFIFLGLLQGLAWIRDSNLLVLARSTASSPLSLAFYNSNGVEFWALNHKVIVDTDKSEHVELDLSPGDINKTNHPYFIKMIYAYPFAFSHELPEVLWRRSLNLGLCKDPKVQEILKIQGNIKKIVIEIRTANPLFKDEPKILAHECGKSGGGQSE